MSDNTNKNRIQQIQDVLIEIANGNFAYELETSELNDELDALAIIVNMTIEEIKDRLLHQNFTNLNESYEQMVQLYFVLDIQDKVLLFNKGIKQFLGYSRKELKQSTFSSLLSTSSQEIWQHYKKKLNTKKSSYNEKHLLLTFRTKLGMVMKINCLIGRHIDVKNDRDILFVTAVEIVQRSKKRAVNLRHKVSAESHKSKEKKSSTPKNSVHLSTLDISKLQEVHHYILTHLQEKLPSLVALAHLVGTNEHKLKIGFKKMYGETVFRFLIQERLRRASILIQHSDLPFKEIAYLVGFKSVPHFSRAFKERFEYSPRSLRKSIHSKNTPK